MMNFFVSLEESSGFDSLEASRVSARLKCR